MSLLNRMALVLVKNPETPDESRLDVRGNIVGNKGYFPVDIPIYVGDFVERADPRGDVVKQRVTRVTVWDAGSPAVNHIEARLSDLA